MKSANVLVTSVFDAFLCDFGIAKCMGNNKLTIVGGTAPYYAPELVTEMTTSDNLGYRPPNKIDLSTAQDIYSFGYIAWEIYYECLAYSNYSDEVARKMKFNDVTLKNDVPLPLDMQIPWVNIIKQSWYFDPRNRITATQCIKSLVFLKSQLEQVFREDSKAKTSEFEQPSKQEISKRLKNHLKIKLKNMEKKQSSGVTTKKKISASNPLKKNKKVMKKISGSLEKPFPVKNKNLLNKVVLKRHSLNQTKKVSKEERSSKRKSVIDTNVEKQYEELVTQIENRFGFEVDNSFPFSSVPSNLVDLMGELRSIGYSNIIPVLIPPHDFEKISDHLKEKLTFVSFTNILSLNSWIFQKK